MKILSLSLCLAAVACVSAQTAPEQQSSLNAVGVNDNYAWALSANPQELSSKIEEVQDAITEIAFRTALIQSMTKVDTLDVQDEDCELKEVLSDQLHALTTLSNTASTLPVIGVGFSFMTQSMDGLLSILETGETPLDTAIQALDYAFNSLSLSLEAIQLAPIPVDFSPILKAIADFKPVVRRVIHCLNPDTEAIENEITPQHCDATADLYRILAADASVKLPLFENTDDALRRALVGTRAVLDASRNSVPAMNSELLQSHSIFTADLLSQYREVLLNNPSLDEKSKIYAQASLGVIVGVSNALEACIRVAADPAEASTELDDELAGDHDEGQDEEVEN